MGCAASAARPAVIAAIAAPTKVLRFKVNFATPGFAQGPSDPGICARDALTDLVPFIARVVG